MKVYPIALDKSKEYFVPQLEIFCPICGQNSRIEIKDRNNLRDDCYCSNCNSTNRQRQLIIRLINTAFGCNQSYGKSLLDVVNSLKSLNIYNTECSGPIHKILSDHPNYTSSEFFSNNHEPGEFYNGMRHEDLQKTSFDDNSFDFILSADVFEHIPNPYKAFKELSRILKNNGKHIFTVPFHHTLILDDKRAYIDEHTKELVLIQEPIYHHDPIHPSPGALVYTIFSLEMLVKLRKIGLMTDMYQLYDPKFGILGANGLVFESTKLAFDELT